MSDHILIFLLSLSVEIAYSTYTLFVSQGHVKSAVVSSSAIALLKMGLIYQVVFNISLIFSVVLGQALGTYLVVSIYNRRVINERLAKEGHK